MDNTNGFRIPTPPQGFKVPAVKAPVSKVTYRGQMITPEGEEFAVYASTGDSFGI